MCLLPGDEVWPSSCCHLYNKNIRSILISAHSKEPFSFSVLLERNQQTPSEHTAELIICDHQLVPVFLVVNDRWSEDRFIQRKRLHGVLVP